MEISRVTRTREEAKAFYNQISRWYDLLAGMSEKKCWEVCVQKLRVQEGEQLLEIGFGTGSCLLNLAELAGPHGRVYGIDISEAMCEVAQEKVKIAGFTDRVGLRCGDAIHLPFNDNLVDAVIMNFTLELFDTPEIPILLSECHRVLRNNGRIGVVSLSKKQDFKVMIRIYEWAHRWFPRLVDCRPIFVEEAVFAAGFQPVDIADLSLWGLPVKVVVAIKK
ncbi:MAG: methyltransferase domain-containing protein [Euryarchaeota archaeon]|nr:methyltransferase domain-containing protein [Euryarchaeota archaeon]